MVMIRLSALGLLLSIVVLQACDGNTLTAPTDVRSVNPAALVGAWVGPMPTGMPGEDWSSVTLTINHTGAGVAGYLRPRAGVDHPLTITFWPSGEAGIEVLELTANQSIPCFRYGISVTGLEYRRDRAAALVGRTVGRCPNTLMGEVRLVRG